MKDLTNIIGVNIKKIREKKNLTHQDLALLLDKRVIAVKRMEQGVYKLTIKHVDEIATALNVPFKNLFEPVGSKPKKK